MGSVGDCCYYCECSHVVLTAGLFLQLVGTSALLLVNAIALHGSAANTSVDTAAVASSPPLKWKGEPFLLLGTEAVVVLTAFVTWLVLLGCYVLRRTTKRDAGVEV